VAVQKFPLKFPSSSGSKSVNPSTHAKSGRWLWFWVGMTGSYGIGNRGALFVALSSTPLLQTNLSPEEKAIFGKAIAYPEQVYGSQS